jgi:hypothetical protein
MKVPMNIPTKFDSNWPIGFREVDKNVKVYRLLDISTHINL